MNDLLLVLALLVSRLVTNNPETFDNAIKKSFDILILQQKYKLFVSNHSLCLSSVQCRNLLMTLAIKLTIHFKIAMMACCLITSIRIQI